MTVTLPTELWRNIWLSPYVSISLFSHLVAKALSSAPLSLTSVFGMGTGGPSASSTLTFWWLVRESTKRFALDGSHHRCSPLWAKNSTLYCFLYAQTLSGSIPKHESIFSALHFTKRIDFLVTRAGIEPALPAWEAGVLTAWPTSRLNQGAHCWAPLLFWCTIRGSNPGHPD